MTPCPPADLEAFVYDELGPAAHDELAAHVRACSICQREVAWLRAERRAFSERAHRDDRTPPPFELVARRALHASAVVSAERHDTARARLRQHRVPITAALVAAAAFAVLLGRSSAVAPRTVVEGPPERLVSEPTAAAGFGDGAHLGQSLPGPMQCGGEVSEAVFSVSDEPPNEAACFTTPASLSQSSSAMTCEPHL